MESIQVKSIQNKIEFINLLKELSPFGYMILERKLVLDKDRDIIFNYFSAEEDFSAWDWGTLFSKHMELRWIRNSHGFNVVITGECLEKLSDYESLDDCEKKDKEYYLWGVRTEGKRDEWREMRIPRILKYPVPGTKQRIKILVREYYNEATGELEHYRFTGIREVKDA